MDGIELFGAGATILSLLAMGFGIGVWHERIQRKNESVVASLNTVRDALSSIRLDEFRVASDRPAMGAQLTLQYVVENRLRVPIEV